MPLPKVYRLAVRHNFGANATVTVKGERWRIDPADGVLKYANTVWINAATVADDTDENSADQDNDTNKDYGLEGIFQVSGTNVTGEAKLYLVTKDGTDYSDTQSSKELALLRFESENGPKIANFEE